MARQANRGYRRGGVRRASSAFPGAQRAAVLMAALGAERAANVMQRMDEDEIESLSMEMARLSSVGAETTESVFSELAAEAGARRGRGQRRA